MTVVNLELVSFNQDLLGNTRRILIGSMPTVASKIAKADWLKQRQSCFFSNEIGSRVFASGQDK